MSNIKLARVDDRLIHGQVVTNWVQYTNAKRIIIIDDATANDSFTSRIIAMAAPQGVKVDIFTISQAIEKLQEGLKQNTILLAKTPGVYLELVKNNIEIPYVNIGGMGANNNRTKFHKNISAGPQERKDIKELLNHDIPVNIQIISNDNKVRITESMLDN